MLINKATNNAVTVKAIPSKSGNGFTQGEIYTFTYYRNGLYRTENDHGYQRYEDFGIRSAHLWDSIHWRAAGHFQIIEIIP